MTKILLLAAAVVLFNSQFSFAQLDPGSLAGTTPIGKAVSGPNNSSNQKPVDTVQVYTVSEDEYHATSGTERQFLDAILSPVHSVCTDIPMYKMSPDLFQKRREQAFDRMDEKIQQAVSEIQAATHGMILPSNVDAQMADLMRSIEDIKDDEFKQMISGTNSFVQMVHPAYRRAGSLWTLSVPVNYILKSDSVRAILGGLTQAASLGKLTGEGLFKYAVMLPVNSYLDIGLVTVPSYIRCQVRPNSPLYSDVVKRLKKTTVGIFRNSRSMFLQPQLVVSKGTPGIRLGYGRVYGDLKDAADFHGHTIGASVSFSLAKLAQVSQLYLEQTAASALLSGVGPLNTLPTLAAKVLTSVPAAIINRIGLNFKTATLFQGEASSVGTWDFRNITYGSISLEYNPTPISYGIEPEFRLAPYILNVGRPWQDKSRLWDVLANWKLWLGLNDQLHTERSREEIRTRERKSYLQRKEDEQLFKID